MKYTKFLTFLFLFVSLNCFAATYYVDCSASSNGDGTELSPKNTFSGITVGSGDVIYLKPGVVCTSDKAMGSDGMIEVLQNADGVTIGQYPSAITTCNTSTGNNCPILDGGNTVNIGVYVLNADTFTMSDVFIRNNDYHNFRHFGTDNQSFTATVSRVRMQQAGPTDDVDGTYSTLTKGTCSLVGRASNGGVSTTITFTNSVVDTCSRLGFDHRWWVVARHVNGKAFRTGYDRVIGGHGFTAHPLGGDVTSGWTYVSGTCPGSDCVYSRAVASATDEEQLIWDRVTSPNVKLERIANGNTNPTQGYFSVVSDTTIYVNFGYAPPTTGNGVRVIRQPIQLDIYNSEAAYNYLKDDGNLEGSGFHFDDTTPGRCFRCFSHDNEGNGIYLNHSSPYWTGIIPTVVGSISINNGDSTKCTGSTCGNGLFTTGGGYLFLNNTIYNSLDENINLSGSFNTCGRVVNNIVHTGDFGVRTQADADTKCTSANIHSNITYNHGTTECEIGSCTEMDPEFKGRNSITKAEDVQSKNQTVCTAGKRFNLNYKDYYNRPLKYSIGAIECGLITRQDTTSIRNN